MSPDASGIRYEVELPNGVEQFETRQVRDLIRSGLVGSLTPIRVAGTDDWISAADAPELRRYVDLAAKAREKTSVSATPSVSSRRLILYLALGGLVAGAMMSLLAPICLIIGVFAKFVISFGAFGAVLALGINSAVGEQDNRLINMTAASFAAGGLLAWLMRGTGEFTVIHFAVIGLVGAAGLAWTLGFDLRRSAAVVITAVIFFPLSIIMIGAFIPKGEFSMGISGLLLLPLLLFIPSIPFAIFGGVLGAVMSMTRREA